MAKELRVNVLKKIEKDPALYKKYKEDFQLDRILSKVHFIRILDEAEQSLLYIKLEEILQKLPKLRLIIFDTFGAHFRLPDMNYSEKKRMTQKALMTLMQCATKY